MWNQFDLDEITDLAYALLGLTANTAIDLLSQTDQGTVKRYNVAAGEPNLLKEYPVKSMAMCILAIMHRVRDMMAPGNRDTVPSAELAGWFELGSLLRPHGAQPMPIMSTVALEKVYALLLLSCSRTGAACTRVGAGCRRLRLLLKLQSPGVAPTRPLLGVYIKQYI